MTIKTGLRLKKSGEKSGKNTKTLRQTQMINQKNSLQLHIHIQTHHNILDMVEHTH